MPKFSFLFFLFQLLIISKLTGASLPVRLINVNDGLSNSSVNCVFQDHFGFMWFGTHDGLNCYDGKRFLTFRNRVGDKSSLSYNYIYSIAEDKKAQIWVATGQGVSIYNRLTGDFGSLKWRIPRLGNQNLSINGAVNVLKADGQGNMFIGTNGVGLFVQSAADTVATQVPCKAFSGENIDNSNVRSVACGKNGEVWVAIEGYGIFQYIRESKTLKPVFPELKDVNCVVNDGRKWWIGTRHGLYFYTKGLEKPVASSRLFEATLNSEDISSVAVADANKLYVGTINDGLYMIDLGLKKVQHLNPTLDKLHSISSESVLGLTVDKESRVWIATLKGGINIIEKNRSSFHIVSPNPFDKNTLSSSFISSLSEGSDGKIWIGTDGGGVNVWDRQSYKFQIFKHSPNDRLSLSSNLVTGTITDSYGNTWVATYGGGINRFVTGSKSFIHYKCIVPGKEENNYVWALYQDHNQRLWATTFTGGYMYYYNKQDDRFDLFDKELINIIALTEDKKQQLWGGSAIALIKIDVQNKKHKYYDVGKPIRAICEDSHGDFWIGTESGGLLLFDRTKGQVIKQYTDKEGLCNNSVLNILEDRLGNLWLSTFAGLSCFNPRLKKFNNFYRENGLPSNQFSSNAALKLKNGEMFFGGINGFTYFFPDSVTNYRATTTPVYLSDIKVDNHLINTNDKYVKGFTNAGINSIEIPFQKANLSLSFSSVDFNESDNTKYAYYLENWDKNWLVTAPADEAIYSRLSEGTYYLKVKKGNASGKWQAQQTLLKIVVLPPWYRSMWAYLSYGLILSFSIYRYNKYRTNKAKLEQEVELAKASVEKEKELSEKKTAFFTNISHEFRTPITLIINPLKDYLQRQADPSEKQALDVVYTNAQKLLKLIDQLLAFKKIGSQVEQPKPSMVNFVQLCSIVHKNFTKEAETKRLKYNFVDQCVDCFVYADYNQLEVVIDNLYANAIKYTPEGGNVTITLCSSEDEIILKVVDTGPGIPANTGDRIFEKYFRSPLRVTASQPGFGIGLYLAKTYVDAHNGKISYQSEEGAGTLFEIRLPKVTDKSFIPENSPESDSTTNTAIIEEAEFEENIHFENFTDNRQSILIVEDNKQLSEYISSVLKDGYRIYTASNGEQGYEAIQKQMPDLVITDIMMDIKDGIELCTQVKSDPTLSHIPIIVLTAITDDQMRLTVAQIGADDFLTKPFERELLVARVNTLIKKKNTLQQYFYNEITLRKQDLKVLPEYQEFLKECIRIIDLHIAEEFNITKFTSEIGMSRSNLYRKVKLVSGLSITGFVRFIRLRKAAELIINTNMTISEISFRVGMTDLRYFRKQFHSLFGMNPSDYLKKYRGTFVKKNS